jgi:hypothetical protein
LGTVLDDQRTGTLRVEILQNLFKKSIALYGREIITDALTAGDGTGALTGGTNGHWPKGKVNYSKIKLEN